MSRGKYRGGGFKSGLSFTLGQGDTPTPSEPGAVSCYTLPATRIDELFPRTESEWLDSMYFPGLDPRSGKSIPTIYRRKNNKAK